MIGAAQFQNVRSAPVATAAATFRAATARQCGNRKGPARHGVQAGRLGIRAHPLGVCQEDEGTLTQLRGGGHVGA